MLDENNEKTGRADGTGAHINAPEVPDGRERMPPVQAGSGGGGVFASFALFWTVSGTFAVLRCNYQFGKESLKFGIFALPEEWEDTARRRGRNRANCRDVRADDKLHVQRCKARETGLFWPSVPLRWTGVCFLSGGRGRQPPNPEHLHARGISRRWGNGSHPV